MSKIRIAQIAAGESSVYVVDTEGRLWRYHTGWAPNTGWEHIVLPEDPDRPGAFSCDRHVISYGKDCGACKREAAERGVNYEEVVND